MSPFDSELQVATALIHGARWEKLIVDTNQYRLLGDMRDGTPPYILARRTGCILIVVHCEHIRRWLTTRGVTS